MTEQMKLFFFCCCWVFAKISNQISLPSGYSSRPSIIQNGRRQGWRFIYHYLNQWVCSVQSGWISIVALVLVHIAETIEPEIDTVKRATYFCEWAYGICVKTLVATICYVFSVNKSQIYSFCKTTFVLRFFFLTKLFVKQINCCANANINKFMVIDASLLLYVIQFAVTLYSLEPVNKLLLLQQW